MKSYKLIILIFLLIVAPLSIAQADPFGYSNRRIETEGSQYAPGKGMPTEGSFYDPNRVRGDMNISPVTFAAGASLTFSSFPWANAFQLQGLMGDSFHDIPPELWIPPDNGGGDNNDNDCTGPSHPMLNSADCHEAEVGQIKQLIFGPVD